MLRIGQLLVDLRPDSIHIVPLKQSVNEQKLCLTSDFCLAILNHNLGTSVSCPNPWSWY